MEFFIAKMNKLLNKMKNCYQLLYFLRFLLVITKFDPSMHGSMQAPSSDAFYIFSVNGKKTLKKAENIFYFLLRFLFEVYL